MVDLNKIRSVIAERKAKEDGEPCVCGSKQPRKTCSVCKPKPKDKYDVETPW